MRSLREPKALTIQPMKCRSDQNMAQILSKRRQQNSFQVVHFASARRFDDGHPEILLLRQTTPASPQYRNERTNPHCECRKAECQSQMVERRAEVLPKRSARPWIVRRRVNM